MTTLHREGVRVSDYEDANTPLGMYSTRDIDRIIEYCNIAQAFFGIPFCIPDIYQCLNDTFPSAKFILTTRGSGEDWFRSCKNMAIYLYGKIPSLDDFRRYPRSYYGWSYESHQALFGEGIEFDDAETKIKVYNEHIEIAKAYFDGQPDRLLVVNMQKECAFREICEFLQLKSRYDSFPVLHHKSEL